jgi:glycine/sarcosine N-methyltransferase
MADENVEYYDRLASVYDLFFDDFAQSMQAEGDWLSRELKRSPVRRVLDASCGTGRQAIPLAKRGFDVVGADPSEAMLAIARSHAQSAGVTIPFVNAAFKDLPARFGSEFDAVIALGNGLCHARGPGEISASLRGLAHCCKEGKVCLVGIKDFQRIELRRPRFYPRQILDRNGERTLLFEVWDFADPILTVNAFLVHGQPSAWSIESAATKEYMLMEDELRSLASQAGFRRVERLDHPHEDVYHLQR